MKIRVKRLVVKKTASGDRFYWEPTPAERKAGWKGKALGLDASEAIAAAHRANAELEEWKGGGAKPRHVARHHKRATVGHGIARYRAEVMDGTHPDGRPRMAASTRRTAGTPLKRLEFWAGDKAIHWVTRARVRALRDAMLAPPERGGIGHDPAFKVLERGRILWQWFLDQELAETNPFLRFGLAKPAPRQVFWEDRHFAPVEDAARALGWPSIAAAVRIGYEFGQRESDNLKLAIGDWREIPKRKFRADPAIHDMLLADATGGPDAGKVMGVYVLQGKTRRWVGIPAEGTTRALIEAQIAEARKARRITILGDEKNGGRPWVQDDFIHAFAEVRAHAVARLREAGDDQLAGEIAALWYGDLRRSCVVYLGELGLDDAAIAAITGHSLATIKSILETYMPRTEGMAARAVATRREARGEAGKVIELRKANDA